jgi:hypothetical protein
MYPGVIFKMSMIRSPHNICQLEHKLKKGEISVCVCVCIGNEGGNRVKEESVCDTGVVLRETHFCDGGWEVSIPHLSLVIL